MKNWENRIVWIIGAASGIGKAFALELCGRGAKVIVSAPERELLEQVQAETHTGEMLVLPLDITDTPILEQAAETALAWKGHIDMLINNAGISQRAMLADTDPGVLEKLIRIDLLGHMIATRFVLPSMLKRGEGHIVGTSSIAGKFGSPLRTAYCAAKHGLIGFYDSLRAETWEKGIEVTVGIPGFVRTDISKHALTGSGAAHNKMDPNQAKGISAEECARAIIRGIEKGKREVYTGLDMRARMALLLQRLLPGVLAKAIRTADVT